MFRNKQLDRIEKKLDTLNSWLARDITEIRFFLADLPPEPVSPAKAPKKRKRLSFQEYEEAVGKTKRKYVKSGKYAKKLTK